jgi:hypothetical protein
MAELGIIVSIVGLVGAGAKLSIVLFDFASTIGSAGYELQAIGTEISLFCSVLKQVQGVLSHAHFHYSAVAIHTAQEILDRCQAIFDNIEDIVLGLRDVQSRDKIPTTDFVRKVKWTFKKSKVQVLRSTLESCKITLHIMLTTMELAERVSLRGYGLHFSHNSS